MKKIFVTSALALCCMASFGMGNARADIVHPEELTLSQQEALQKAAEKNESAQILKNMFHKEVYTSQSVGYGNSDGGEYTANHVGI